MSWSFPWERTLTSLGMGSCDLILLHGISRDIKKVVGNLGLPSPSPARLGRAEREPWKPSDHNMQSSPLSLPGSRSAFSRTRPFSSKPQKWECQHGDVCGGIH